MPKEIISTPEAPQSPMYSQAVKAGHTIYVAGTTGVDVTTGEFAGPAVKEQARQALLNCQAILRAAGGMPLHIALLFNLLAVRSILTEDLGRHMRKVRIVVFDGDAARVTPATMNNIVAHVAPV